MKEYGTNVVGGTSPGKGEVMQTVSQCLTPCMKLWNRHRLTLLLSLFRHRFAADAIMEAADAGIQLIVCIAEGIPTLDVIKAHQFIKQKGGNTGWS